MSRYTFVPYSNAWPAQFAQLAAQLGVLIGDELLHIHHIGSTSVPGLAAKPIIDVLPITKNIDRIDACSAQLEQAGFVARGEYGLPGRRYFTKNRSGYRIANVHIYQQDHPDVHRHLAFCAYLRAHPAVRNQYAEIKQIAFTNHPDDINAYNDAKNDWIKHTEQLALQYWQDSTT